MRLTGASPTEESSCFNRRLQHRRRNGKACHPIRHLTMEPSSFPSEKPPPEGNLQGYPHGFRLPLLRMHRRTFMYTYDLLFFAVGLNELRQPFAWFAGLHTIYS